MEDNLKPGQHGDKNNWVRDYPVAEIRLNVRPNNKRFVKISNPPVNNQQGGVHGGNVPGEPGAVGQEQGFVWAVGGVEEEGWVGVCDDCGEAVEQAGDEWADRPVAEGELEVEWVVGGVG